MPGVVMPIMTLCQGASTDHGYAPNLNIVIVDVLEEMHHVPHACIFSKVRDVAKRIPVGEVGAILAQLRAQIEKFVDFQTFGSRLAAGVENGRRM